MTDSVHLNGAGRAHLNSLVDAGKVDKSSGWDLSSAERDGLDANMFLGEDSAVPEKNAGHWKYPFGKGGKVFASALRAVDSRAGAQGETEIQDAAKAALQKIEGKKTMSAGEDAPTGVLKDREIFKAGKWRASTGAVEATSAMLDQIVASYNGLNSKVQGYAIPLKLGHTNVKGAPAMGYASNVRRQGDTLLADFTDMPPEIVDAISAKRYNSVSVELWPKIVHDGAEFEQVLSGVALLGAEWPAVKGLKPVYASEFAADGALMLSQEEDTNMPQTFTQEQYDAVKTEAATALAAETAKVTAQTERAERAEAALASFTDAAEKADIATIIEAAEKAGKIVPANKEKVTAFAEKLRSTLKGDDRKAVITMFKEFVENLPKKVDYTESGRGSVEKPGDGANAADEVNQKVKAAQKAAGGEKKLSYKDALAQVFEEDPDLKTRYAEENR